MARHLTAHERLLWQRITAQVRPLPGRSAPPASPEPTPPQPTRPTAATPQPPPKPAPPTPHRRPAVTAATLDASWDRRLRSGDITPDRIIDLHGHSLDAAHARLADALDSANAQGQRIILVITGKGRSDRPGRIRRELAHWLDTSSQRSRIAALRPAHPRHGGGGAFYLILRRG